MISEEVKQQIYKLREEGKSILDISIQLRVGKASVSFWCNKFDPEKKYNHTKKLEQEEKNKIIQFYKTVNNLQLTKKHFKQIYSEATIRDVLIKSNEYIGRKKVTDEFKSRQKSLNVINWKKDKKIKLVEYKGGKCEKCGYDKCIRALDFHHIDPLQKDFDISSNSYSFEKMKKEADKCILVCANCHREIHAGYLKI